MFFLTCSATRQGRRVNGTGNGKVAQEPAQRRMVALRAQVDNSMSSSKMMRLRKAELVEACEEHGLAAFGTKQQLVSALQAHFHEPEAVAAPVQQPEEVEVAESVPDVQELTAKVGVLDEAIKMKTDELKRLHEGDRTMMTEIVKDLSDVKTFWQDKLEEVSAGLEELTALKQGQVAVNALHKQQQELQEELQVLSRMLKLREAEIQTLQAQLAQVQQDRTKEKAAQKTERLAVLAMASQVAAADPVPVFDGPPGSFWSPPGRLPQIPVEPKTPVEPKIRNRALAGIDFVSESGEAVPISSGTPTPRSDVFGLAYPGLLAAGAVMDGVKKYQALRDQLVSGAAAARVTDAVTVGLVAVMTLSALG